MDFHLNNPASSPSCITPKIFIFQILVENIQIVVAITCQGMCTSFFIFECTIGCDIVYYYVYQEDEGKEGGKNAVSRLVDNFKDMGYFSNSCMGELII